jgi:hypothetical protein
MARSSKGLVGNFCHLDSLLEAIDRLHQAGSVRGFTLFGCLLGAAIGLALTIFASKYYPLITGGKPIVSIPPFLIIVFELTILFGGLLTLGGMLLNSRLPGLHIGPGYDPRFLEDRFGLWVPCGEKEFDSVSEMLRDSGAEEVQRGGD